MVRAPYARRVVVALLAAALAWLLLVAGTSAAAPTLAPIPTPASTPAPTPVTASPAVAGTFGDDATTRLVVLGAAISTGTTLAAGFFLFGRRRRADDRDDRLLSRAAAAAYEPADGGVGAAPEVDPGTGGTDVYLPRWRRPSLMAARRSDPARSVGSPAHMAFEQADAGVEGERHRVRYGLVRLLDRPDQIAGSTIDSLDAGDEVAILEVSGLYRRVVTPDGRTGWLHKMTLGDVVPAPLAGDDAQVDPDVLVAYLAARGRV